MGKSVSILYAERFINIALGLLSSVILARLLSPEEIGIASLAAAAAVICHMVRDMGIGTYISIAPNISAEQRRTCLGMAYLLASGAALLLLALAIPLSNFYREPRLVYVTGLLAASMALSPTVAIRCSFLVRERRFVQVSLINIFNIAIFCILSIGFAKFGASYLSVPLATLVAAIFTTGVVGLLDGFKSLFKVSLKGGRELLSVSKWSFLVLLTQSASDRSPEFSLARIQGFSSSAFFEKSLTAVDLAKRLIVEALIVLLHPRLRQAMTDNDRLRQVSTECLAIFFLIGLSIALVLSLVARSIVEFLFGSTWAQSGVLLETVAWVTPFALLNYLILQLMYYFTTPKRVAIWSMLARTALVVTVISSAMYGLESLARGLVLAEGVVTLGGIYLIRTKIAWPYLSKLVAVLAPAILIGYGAAFYFHSYAIAAGWGSFLVLTGCSVIWLSVVLLLLALTRPVILRELFNSLSTKSANHG